MATKHCLIALGIVVLLVAAGLAPSKGAGRRTISEGGASVNNVRIADDTQSYSPADTLGDGWLVVRRGRRAVSGVRLLPAPEAPDGGSES